MTGIDYRRLERGQAALLAQIDRAETIDGEYRVRNSELVLEPVAIDIAGWEPVELAEYVARLQALLEAGGTAWGAWCDARLVGLGTLDGRPVGTDATLLLLDMLYVGASFRRRGIGRKLFSLLARDARSRGATRLYVSATPSRGTVESYLVLGARLATPPDPELYRREPEDVHLVIDLGPTSLL